MTSARFMEPRSPYFMVKMPKEEQKERKEKIGNLYFPQDFAFMRRGLQFGIIEKIGSDAAEYFPQAEVGDYLLLNHIIEGKRDDKGYNFYHIDEDNEFNYYVVNAFELPGEKNLSYGVSKGKEIVPNRDYIFLEIEEESNEMVEGPSGLMIRKERKKTRAEWSDIMKSNMKRCQQLARNVPGDPNEEMRWKKDPKLRELMEYSLAEIKKLEAENIRISKDINKRKYEPFKVAFLNPEWNESVEISFGEKVTEGDTVYMLGMSCHTEIEIFGKVYIIAETKYFAGAFSYFKKIVNEFKSTSCGNTSIPSSADRRRSKKTID